jgi:hypothetical protein
MSSTEPPAAARGKLPVLGTFKETYRAVFSEHLGDLPKASAVPFLLALVFTAAYMAVNLQDLSDVLAGNDPSPEGATGSLLNLVLLPISFVPYVIFAVAWHRLLLLGPGDAPATLVPSWKGCHWKYLWYGILVTIIVYGLLVVVLIPVIAIAAFSGMGYPGTTGLSWVAITSFLAIALFICLLPYLYARWCLAFPAIAVDERFGLRDSWRLSRGQGWRIVAAAVLVVLPFVVALIIAGQLVAGSLIAAAATADLSTIMTSLFVTSLVNMAVGFVVMALIVTMVTVAFRTLTGWIPSSQAIADRFR